MATVTGTAKLYDSVTLRLVENIQPAVFSTTCTVAAVPTVLRGYTQTVTQKPTAVTSLSVAADYLYKGGVADLEFSATLRNYTATHIRIDIAALIARGLPEGTPLTFVMEEDWLREDQNKLPSSLGLSIPRDDSFYTMRTPIYLNATQFTTSNFSLTADNTRLKFGSVSADSAFTPVMTVVATRNVETELIATITQSTTANYTVGSNTADILSFAVFVRSKPTRILQFESDFTTVTTSLTADNTRLKFGYLPAVVTSAVSSSAIRYPGILEDLAVVSTTDCTPIVFSEAGAAIESSGTLSITATRIRPGASTMSTASTQTATGSVPMFETLTNFAGDFSLYFGGDVDIEVDWGDGTVETYSQTQDWTTVTDANLFEVSHTYTTSTTKTVSISGSAEVVSGYTGVSTVSGADYTRATAWGEIRPLWLYKWGGNLTSTGANRVLSGILPGEIPSSVTSLRSALTTVSWYTGNPWANIGDWDTSQVTDMSSCFAGTAFYIKSHNISTWDTSSVTTMEAMFSGNNAYPNYSLNSWDTSAVTTMKQMFKDSNLTSTTQIDSWNTSAVTDMSQMFQNTQLKIELDIASWNTGAVTDMSYMFDNGTMFAIDLSTWNTVSVTNMQAMFRDTGNFNSDLSSWNTGSVTDMSQMFKGSDYSNTGVTQRNINTWNTSSVTTMSQMFESSTARLLSLNSWDTSAVTNMYRMFAFTSDLDPVVANWDTSAVTTMEQMFVGADQFDHAIGTWDTSSVTTAESIFNDATVFNQDISGWDLTGISTQEYMFYQATAFDRDLTGIAFDWSTAFDGDSMFYQSGMGQTAMDRTIIYIANRIYQQATTPPAGVIGLPNGYTASSTTFTHATYTQFTDAQSALTYLSGQSWTITYSPV